MNLEKLPPGTPREVAGGLVALGDVGLNVRNNQPQGHIVCLYTLHELFFSVGFSGGG